MPSTLATSSKAPMLPGKPPMSEPSSAPLLHLNDFSVAFDGQVVVDKLSLSLNAGETLAIVGESGSGKSVSALGAIGLLPSNARSLANACWKAVT